MTIINNVGIGMLLLIQIDETSLFIVIRLPCSQVYRVPRTGAERFLQFSFFTLLTLFHPTDIAVLFILQFIVSIFFILLSEQNFSVLLVLIPTLLFTCFALCLRFPPKQMIYPHFSTQPDTAITLLVFM